MVGVEAVLSGIAAAIERALQPFAAVGMAGDSLVPAVGFVNDGAEFFDGERGLGEKLAVLIHPGAMGHVNLHPIHAVGELLARGFAGLDRAINYLHAFGQNVLDLRSVTLQWIPAGGGNGAAGAEDARARNVAFFDGLL